MEAIRFEVIEPEVRRERDALAARVAELEQRVTGLAARVTELERVGAGLARRLGRSQLTATAASVHALIATIAAIALWGRSAL